MISQLLDPKKKKKKGLAHQTSKLELNIMIEMVEAHERKNVFKKKLNAKVNAE